jgi:hypothetical protein
VLGNSLGTLAVLAVALVTFRRRPLGNALLLTGTACAAGGSAVAGLGVAPTAGFVAVALALLYAGFLAASGTALHRRPLWGSPSPSPR